MKELLKVEGVAAIEEGGAAGMKVVGSVAREEEVAKRMEGVGLAYPSPAQLLNAPVPPLPI